MTAILKLETKSESELDVKAVLDDLTNEVKAKAENDNKLVDRLDKLEAKLAHNDNEPTETKSAGEQLVESDAFKDWAVSGKKGSADIELKAITTGAATVGTGTDGSTSLVPSHHVPGIIAPAVRPLTIRALLAQGSTTSGVIQYVRETGFTNNAAPVAEGAAKPYSDITFDQETENVRVIAHLFKASRQVLEDSAQLASYIDTRARDGLADVEEAQLLNGDGTGQNLNGLIPNATAFDTALVDADDNKADIIRRAILQVRLAEYRADGIVLHPTDWADIEVLKETTGGYIWSNPTINNGQNLWGIPVVDTTAMPVGNFLVGAFARAAQIFDRWQDRVEVSNSNVDDFEKNLVTIRAEERLALAIYRKESFVYGAFEEPVGGV
ncbi:phage major capsid protein [Falsochrobactrum shanghaiense]|uniref:Phage major capsid protein n=1 Tax=Falsochrobactrum shanghaiense TaxID=2201899 RepID=A0A316JJ29_9HYPH|nr:phage major capsid protein [Falsochrobactrum shanghaiense]PWL19263.1 phage major capsid protein [Falsochrobactrum shanghaiense]